MINHTTEGSTVGHPGLAAAVQQDAVYYIRLPKAGTCCPKTGLSRTKLNQLVLPCPENNFRPPVKSISMKPRGSARGCRLIDFASLIAYLRSLEAL